MLSPSTPTHKQVNQSKKAHRPAHLKNIFSYEQYWAECYGIAAFLPTSRQEMDQLGWDSCDIIIVTGDAYIDHPSPDGIFIPSATFKIYGVTNIFYCRHAPNVGSGVTYPVPLRLGKGGYFPLWFVTAGGFFMGGSCRVGHE